MKRTLYIFICLAIGIAVPGCSRTPPDKPDATNSRAATEKSDQTRLAIAGGNLSAEQANALEASLAKNPDDVAVRTKLLGYYFIARTTNAEAKDASRKHVLWIIKNHPEDQIAGTPYCQIDAILDPDGYRDAKQLWDDQTKAHPKDVSIIGHAAQFFLFADATRAEALFKQAQQLDPNEPDWSNRLAQLYALRWTKDGAKQALAELEKAQAADKSEESKFARLDSLAKAAFESDHFKEAAKYSNELLQNAKKNRDNWNYGNAIHHGNNVLGRIALKNGNAKEAKDHLLKAGETPGSPQLNSFGPNMSLAKELLEAGEKDTVLQYFELCRKFWKLDGGRLDDWSKQVKAGQVPPFGANLLY